MLVHLAVFLLIMLITCTLTLLICWAYDNDGVEIDAGRARPAVLAFPDRSHNRRFPPVGAPLTQPPFPRARLTIKHRGAALSLSPKSHSRRLRRMG